MRDRVSPVFEITGVRNLPKATIIAYGIALIAAGTVSVFLATPSRTIPVVEDTDDKAEHCIAFSALALFADISFPQNGFAPAKSLSLLGCGLAIGIARYFLPHCSFSLLDMGADSTGLLASGILTLLLKRMPQFNNRWE